MKAEIELRDYLADSLIKDAREKNQSVDEFLRDCNLNLLIRKGSATWNIPVYLTKREVV